MAHQMKLMKVKGNGCNLQWPVPPFGDEQRSRGGQGYVVDIEHPLEKGYDEPDTEPSGRVRVDGFGTPLKRHVTGWCEGQMHKLEEAPDATAPTVIDLPMARRQKAEFDEAQKPKSEAPAPAPVRPPVSKKIREPIEVIEGG